MSKKYKVVVDGVSHIVEVEDVDSVGSSSVVREERVVEAKPQTNNSVATENTVKSPLQGLVQDIKVTVGQTVKAGDVLMIVEAMKMENEIVAPKAGEVVKIHQNKGAKVNAGDLLIDIK